MQQRKHTRIVVIGEQKDHHAASEKQAPNVVGEPLLPEVPTEQKQESLARTAQHRTGAKTGSSDVVLRRALPHQRLLHPADRRNRTQHTRSNTGFAVSSLGSNKRYDRNTVHMPGPFKFQKEVKKAGGQIAKPASIEVRSARGTCKAVMVDGMHGLGRCWSCPGFANPIQAFPASRLTVSDFSAGDGTRCHQACSSDGGCEMWPRCLWRVAPCLDSPICCFLHPAEAEVACVMASAAAKAGDPTPLEHVNFAGHKSRVCYFYDGQSREYSFAAARASSHSSVSLAASHR
jgi:hypothetical protein